ncbi:Glycerophosphoryl diester phosphodiesterase precursor [Pseudobythopirellula maris]|uniref:glycerophosphodiester phosphodiesterase n=1 Tax=Pseudobythopirellula maris TaxID=2527991 RepID=A0A5C5ZH47_9BACT|nr:glycerophosphodiester phosphodiesterase [Pseudobythopirellula maris]TWT86191.1 Glycerophosphoryl diester phosphodiesterase precursor [Pseudobythopirellula maris]
MLHLRTLVFLITAALLFGGAAAHAEHADAQNRPLVLAHRGACGYAPEHTLVGVAMAHALGADYIEQDVQLTSDGQAVVMHDTDLAATTNVADLFAERADSQGKWLVNDFTLVEVKRLRVNERRRGATGPARYAGRFPSDAGLPLRVPTLAEEIELIQGLNQAFGRQVGLIVEIKDPAGQRRRGLDVSRETIRVLAEHGYTGPEDGAIIQCFDAAETQRVRRELGCQLRLCQLLGGRTAPDDEALAKISTYAQMIGPSYTLVLTPQGEPSGLAEAAGRHGLMTFPYTVRRDALPSYAADAPALLSKLVQAGADGFFTDFPDDRMAE